MKVSIIIKAYNEEANISACIESALDALKGIKGEVILVDSLSSDRTAEIAKKYPIRIFQLEDGKDRRCSVGAQIGYLESKGDYIYLLDGDMVLDPHFIKEALSHFSEKVGAVGGLMSEPYTGNLISRRYQEKFGNMKVGLVDYLEGGGLYLRKAIEEAGHFANPRLFSNEEYEIGFRLRGLGWKLLRIDAEAVTHRRESRSSYDELFARFRSRYLQGGGQVLRASLFTKDFRRHAWRLKLYLCVIAYWLMLILSIVTGAYKYMLAATAIFILAFIIKKRGIRQAAFSLVSWHITAASMIQGFMAGADAGAKIPYHKIK